MSVNFIAAGQKTYVEKFPEGLRNTELKAKVYSLEFSRDEGFYLLDIADSYTLPAKTYGDYKSAAARVIKTHYSKKGNTGILSTGLKGAGKSLFVKFIANAMIELGVPVIQINKPYQGEEIFNFIENIGNCVLIFDEFGKNYSQYANSVQPTQVGLLSLLDGLGNSKRLHLFTENDVGTISEYLINRPGRVHYHFKYARLSDEIIKEYCEDHGVPAEIIKELLSLTSKLKVLSFDTVSCLINEWKLHGGTLTEHLNILNISLCRNPNDEDVKVISFVRADGTKLQPKDFRIDFRDNYINMTLLITENGYTRQEYMDALRIDEAISVKGDVYKFSTRVGDNIALRIRTPRY